MTVKTAITAAAVLCAGITAGTSALGADLPRMPYVFEKFCFSCHKEHVQVGPIGILDMRTKAGNPLNEKFIRSNVRFGLNAMPSFRPSEVSDKGLDEIVTYLKELAAYRKVHPKYQPMPVQEGDTRK